MDLRFKTKKQLYALARQYSIPNRSNMSKDMLVKALMSIVFPRTRLPVMSSMTITGIRQDYPSEIPKRHLVSRPSPTWTSPVDPYPIPLAYERDLLVLMPIDPSTSCVCWELSSRTREKYQVQLKIREPHILLKLYIKNQDKNYVLESVRVGQMGNYMFHHYLPGKDCWVELGVDNKKGSYCTIMVSRHVKMPDDQMHDTGKFVSMTVKKNQQGLLELSGLTRMKGKGDSSHTTWKSVSSLELSRRKK